MAFPTVPTVADGRVLTANQLDSVATRTFPDLSGLTKNAGDLLIALVFAYQSSVGSNAAFSGWTGGFTEFFDRQASGTTCIIGGAYKWSTGSETGTIAVTQAGTITGDASMILLSIPGAHPTTPPEAGTAATGTGAAAPPAFNPVAWDVEDTLWIACNVNGMTSGTGSWTANNGAPTNYTDFVGTNPADTSTIGDCGGAVAFRQLAAASDSPAAFAQDTSNARNTAVLVAVRPAAAAPINLPLDAASAAATGTLDLAAPFIPLPLAASSGTASGTLALSAPAQAYRNAVLADSPIAYYRLGEASGTSAVDESGNAHTGTYVNSPPLGQVGALTDDSNTAAQFTTTSSQRVELDTLGTLGSNILTASVEFWFRGTVGVQLAVLGTISTGTTLIYAVNVNSSNTDTQVSGKTNFHLRGANGQVQLGETSTAIYDGTWHHVVWVNQGAGNAHRVWVDGIERTVTMGTNGSPTAANFEFPMMLAARNLRGVADRHLQGLLDEVAFYPTRLTPGRIATHYNIGAGKAVLALDAAGAIASGSLDLTAPAAAQDIPCDPASVAATGSLTLSVTPILPLDASSAAASGSATVSVTPLLPLSASSVVASATATVSVTPILPLASSSATATGSATLIVRPLLPLGAASAAATTGSLGLSVPGPAAISPNPSSSTASGSLTLIVRPLLLLSASSSTATGTATVSVRPLLPLVASSSVATGSLDLTASGAAMLPLVASSATASGTLILTVGAPPDTHPVLDGVFDEAAAGGIVAELIRGGTVREFVRGGVFDEAASGGSVDEPTRGGTPDELKRGGTIREPIRGGDVL